MSAEIHISTKVRSSLVLFVVLSLLSGCKKEEPVQPPPGERKRYNLSDFTPSPTCRSCHPQQYDEWNGSRHHYSANDPIWMLANNALQVSTGGTLKETCWPCHAPLGYLTGNTLPTFQIADLQPLVQEGDNCDMCHTMRAPHTTTDGQIRYHFEPGITKFGPMSDPIPTTGHVNGFDASFSRSDMCRECHDLIVNHIPVEINNTELEKSPWSALAVQCQDCHMSTYTGRAAVGAPVRTNLHRHDFVAVSVPVTNFPFRAYQRSAADSLLKQSASMYVTVPSDARASD
jgi:hypothetical protein